MVRFLNANDLRSFWIVLTRPTPGLVRWPKEDPLWEGQKPYLTDVFVYPHGMGRILINCVQYVHVRYCVSMYIHVSKAFFFSFFRYKFVNVGEVYVVHGECKSWDVCV